MLHVGRGERGEEGGRDGKRRAGGDTSWDEKFTRGVKGRTLVRRGGGLPGGGGGRRHPNLAASPPPPSKPLALLIIPLPNSSPRGYYHELREQKGRKEKTS
jgi:hypothetical protein